ncbi:MAG: prolyl oligopeptidase family serine peptidase [Bacteroidota bacterium]|nr:prolyl oligopeptidase family serine peptidase [Bacteroidota bacterium]MDP4246858.1 prolyl oligopeptidase family serine peptidase [Bacteroidota bacterium]MDP4256929.1 prolyl oligopeptidase family serine peptidase [Bacteroidota bacterium]
MSKKFFILFACLFVASAAFCQEPAVKLTVEKIMRDPKWIGTSPSRPYWSTDGKYLFFRWNPDKAPSDSIYYISREDPTPRKAPYSLLESTFAENRVHYNKARTSYTFSRDGDIFWGDARTRKEKRITQTLDAETNPVFSFHDTRIVYTRNFNLYSWDITTGLTEQLTNFQRASPPKKDPPTAQEKWLADDQLQHIEVLRSRKQKKDLADSIDKINKPKEPKSIFTEDRMIVGTGISADGRFVSYSLLKEATGARRTVVPSYVTESGFTTDIPGRTKVGAPQGLFSSYIFDRDRDTVISVTTAQIPGIMDQPDYVKDYPAKGGAKEKGADRPLADPSDSASDEKRKIKPGPRPVVFYGPYWSEEGVSAVMDIRSRDNKDRWLMSLDPTTGALHLLDRQRDEAWIAGPGIGDGENFGGGNAGWIDDHTFWFQSEASGYSHLYKVNTLTGAKVQLSSGAWEVQTAHLSKDRNYFYISSNESDPGEQQFYRIPVTGGKPERITSMKGSNQVTVSPDEKELAILYSYSNRPWELYLQENKPVADAKGGVGLRQITRLAMSEEFRSYPWRDPEIITFQARDGATVHARIYRPKEGAHGVPRPAVVFVHGAGYLQNAHRWWSSYFHEYMFNNLLADNGYIVLDMDYRGSAGYGRDWRTGIYRHMGGKDLSDQVDGVKWLVTHEGVDPHRVGIYGGSYGGFITLMALFTEPDVFAAGAGLRCVTDWAHYNHGYTSAILNEPYNDSLAYRRSSPIYFAEGLKGHLLMCHGVVDENVHFEDIVRLTQRLIELGKNNWELAVYPLEDHGFVEPSSWTDEYKRVFKLFNTTLK